MTTPATTIKDEIRELIDIQIDAFGQPTPLTASELSECSYRSERIKLFGHELGRIRTG